MNIRTIYIRLNRTDHVYIYIYIFQLYGGSRLELVSEMPIPQPCLNLPLFGPSANPHPSHEAVSQAFWHRSFSHTHSFVCVRVCYLCS